MPKSALFCVSAYFSLAMWACTIGFWVLEHSHTTGIAFFTSKKTMVDRGDWPWDCYRDLRQTWFMGVGSSQGRVTVFAGQESIEATNRLLTLPFKEPIRERRVFLFPSPRYLIWLPPHGANVPIGGRIIREWSDPDVTLCFTVPHWSFAFAFALLPTLWLRHTYRRSRWSVRLRRGLCPSCGYDLRASPGRCPECGVSDKVGITP